MHRIDTPDATPDHRFTEGDPTIPLPATMVSADWLNAVQEELSGVIEGAGLTLDKVSHDQLKAAITKMITDRASLASTEQAGLVELATMAEVLTGTDADRSVTPATLANLLNNLTTPAQFANDKKVATTEFVQRAIGNVRGLNSYNASATLTLGDTGKLVTFFGTAAGQILTLPAANAVPAGVGFWIVNQASVPVQISRTAADTLNINTHSGALSAGGLTILPGDSVFVASNGASVWNVVGWSSNNLFPRQLGSSGYQLLPGGLILQWGRTVAAPLGGASSRIDNYTLPVTFPAAVLFLAGGASSEGGAGVGGWPKESRTTSQVAVGVYNSAASPQPVGSWFFAIGY